jgi:hypothetical protein
MSQSLNDGRYLVSGVIGSRSQIFTKDSVQKTTQRILAFAVVFCPTLLLYTVHKTGHHITQQN